MSALVTGAGIVTPYGDDLGAVVDLVVAGADGRERATPLVFEEGLPGDPVPVLRVDGPRPETVGGFKRPFPDRFTLLAAAAVDRALKAARLADSTLDRARWALVVNTAFGPSATVEKYLKTLLLSGPDQVSAITFSRTVANAVVGELSRRHRLSGPSTLLLGGSALGYAASLIAAGQADVALAVGVDILSDFTVWAYAHSGLLDQGLLMGESGAAVVLESPELSRRRDIAPLAAVARHAAGHSGAAVERITEIERDTIAAVTGAALRGQEPPDLVLGLANHHPPLDEAERAALPAGVRRLLPKRTLGESFGSSEVLAAAIGASLLSRRAAARVLVDACQVGGAVAATLLEHARG